MRGTDPKNTNMRFFRAQDRVFAQNGQWYLASREGEVGPFVRRETAIREAARYVQERRDLDNFQKAREVQTLQSSERSLSILPKDEESEVSLEELILENQR